MDLCDGFVYKTKLWQYKTNGDMPKSFADDF